MHRLKPTPSVLDIASRLEEAGFEAWCVGGAIRDALLGGEPLDWDLASRNDDLIDFFRKAIAFCRRFPVLQRRKFRLGKDLDDDGVPDLRWFGPDGGDPRWNDPEARTICCQLDSSEDGARLSVRRLFFILNGHWDPQWIVLPPLDGGHGWHRAIDTSLPAGADFAAPGREVRVDPGDHYIVNARSTVVLLAR